MIASASRPTAPAGCFPVLGQLLLTDLTGRVLLTATVPGAGPAVLALPGSAPDHGVPPAAAATRAAVQATGLIGLTAGRLLATDWRPTPDGATVLVQVYDHPPLTGPQLAALTADHSNGRGPQLVAAADLVGATGEAAAIRAALAARIEARTADLEAGRPRFPGVLDRRTLITSAYLASPRPGARWHRATAPFEGNAQDVRGLLIAPDGRVLVQHTPASGRTRLPGGAPTPGESPEAALARTCATTVRTRPGQQRLLGHHTTPDTAGAHILATIDKVGQLPSGPCEPATVRLLMTLDQAAQLCEDHLDQAELEEARTVIADLGLPHAERQPVTELPPDLLLL